MSALALSDATIIAHPLGMPVDGRLRYSMTNDLAALYRWLVINRLHHEEFTIKSRDVARLTGWNASRIHVRTMELIERGWLERTERGKYRFVQPIMRFREARL